MSEKRYFNYCFLSPLLISMASFFLGPHFGYSENVILEQATNLVSYLAFTFFYGGLPYLFFLLLYFIWQRGKSGKQIRYFTYLSPFIYTVILLMFSFIFFKITDSNSVSKLMNEGNFWQINITIAAEALKISTSYIVLFHLLYYTLIKFEKIGIKKSAA